MRTQFNHISNLKPTCFCDILQMHLSRTEESATLSDKDALVFGRLFEFGKLGTFLSALPASFAATRKSLTKSFSQLRMQLRSEGHTRINSLSA